MTKAEVQELLSYYRAMSATSLAADRGGKDFQSAVDDMLTLKEFAVSLLTGTTSTADIEPILAKWDSERVSVTKSAIRSAFVQLRIALGNADSVGAQEHAWFKESMQKYKETQAHSALSIAKVAWVKYREAVFDSAALQEETASLVSGFVTDIDYLISLIKKYSGA